MKMPAWLRLSDAALRKLPERLLVVGVIACICVVTSLVIDLWPHQTPLPPAEQTSADSLEATKPDFHARVETTYVRETTYVAVSRQNRAAAIESARRADSLQRVAIVADSVARAQRDTSSRWFLAAQAWHRTADALAADTVKLAAAYTAESTARVAADRRAAEYQRRSAALEDFSKRLAADVRKGDRCRIVWVLGCPSRTQAAVGALALREGLKLVDNLSSGKPALSGIP